MKLKTIKELHEKVKSGEIKGSQLKIILDNDHTSFYVSSGEDCDGEDTWEEITVKEANGYYDIEKLYPLVFPEAMVDWC